MLVDEVIALQAQGFEPCTEVLIHRDLGTDDVLPCCCAAKAAFRIAVIASSKAHEDGLEGVLSFLQRSFSWGFKRCKYMCEILAFSQDIDCGAGMGIALLALREYFNHVQSSSRVVASGSFGVGRGQLTLVAVQLIRKSDPANNNMYRMLLYEQSANDNVAIDEDSSTPELEWMTSNLHYHQCVGIYSTASKHLQVWDYSGWCKYDEHGQCPESAILSARIMKYDSSSGKFDWALWDGKFYIPFGEWINLPGAQVVEAPSKSSFGKCIRKIRSNNDLRHDLLCKRLLPSLYATTGHDFSTTSIYPDKQWLQTLSTNSFMVTAHVTACHMSSSPLPGLGIARSLRSWVSSGPILSRLEDNKDILNLLYLPNRLVIIGIDDMSNDPLCGLTDPCLDTARNLESLGCIRRSSTSARALSGENNVEDLLWDEIFQMANSTHHEEKEDSGSYSFVIPGIDCDVYFLSRRIEKYKNRLTDGVNSDSTVRLACDNILCPSLLALSLTEKPEIRGVTLMGLFQVPEYHRVLSGESNSPNCVNEVLKNAQTFCDRIGYPVVVKGERHGGMLCSSWPYVVNAISTYSTFYQASGKSSCFIQKFIKGTEKTIAFAAINGELTGCLEMTKTITTATGKVWCGEISPVNSRVLAAVKTMVSSCSWTGGGELEFIETIYGGLNLEDAHLDSETGSQTPLWFIIDFNPRFPAWISACCFTGCNLPADLLCHAIHARRTIQGHSTDSLLVQRNLQRYLKFSSVFYTKSVIEIPLAHHIINHRGWSSWENMCNDSGFHRKKSLTGTILSASTNSDSNSRKEKPSSIGQDEIDSTLKGVHGSSTAKQGIRETDNRHYNETLEDNVILDRINSAIFCGKKDHFKVNTPTYIFAQSVFNSALSKHFEYVLDVISGHGDGECRDTEQPKLVVNAQMCISVKSQPLRAVLIAARESNYFAECISMAEVRAANNAGFPFNRIVLTGPGKFWDRGINLLSDCLLDDVPCTFNAIFADSLADLRTIIRRITDSKDGLSTETLGIRFQPAGIRCSRFGLDSSDPEVLRLAAEMIRCYLPMDVRLGMHLHFAASAPSNSRRKWLGQAEAMVALAREFSSLCGRQVEVLDFGGGWQSDFILDEHTKSEMASLINFIKTEFSHFAKITLQFELGKCLTEKSGALLCRVLEVREIELDKESMHSRNRITTECNLFKNDLCPNDFLKNVICRKRAIIVDASVGEISSPHFHPIFWRPANSSDVPNLNHGWQSFESGKDEIWGRTCIEFDQLIGLSCPWGMHGGLCGMGRQLIQVPNAMKVGDFILITCCGSYDMTMQYNFGDGQGRENCLIY